MAARMARDAPSAFCRVGPRHIGSCPSKHVSAIRATSSGLVPSSTRTNATRCPSCLPIRQSCGVPSPCAGRWLRIDVAHAAMSRDGGVPAMLQHTNCAGHPSICISETTRSSSVLSARHANTMDSSRDRVSTGRGERGVFESAMVGMVEGVEISVVRAVCAISTVPAVSADSSAASGPSTPAGLSRSSTLSPVRRRVEPSANRAYPAVGARSRAYRSGHHTDQPSSTRKHGHGHVHRHALGIGPPRDRSTRVPTRASRSARRNRTRRSPAAYGVQSCSPAT